MDNSSSSHEAQAVLPDNASSSRRTVDIQTWLTPFSRYASHDLQSTRSKVKTFLSSKAGHYSVLALVALDVTGIFADFVINLFKCEKKWGDKGWDEALEALGIISLVFSSLFMVELLASIWAWGWGYFRSWFHCFDALVIVAGFVADIVLRGVDEEAASLIVVLRLWRVLKIIEELSVGAQEQVEDLEDRVIDLEKGNEQLRAEVARLKRREAHGTEETIL